MSEAQVLLYVVDGAAVQSIEDALSILYVVVKQLVGCDHCRLGACFGLLDQVRDSRAEFEVVDDGYWSPHAGTSYRALLSPSPRDDNEVMSAEDRGPDPGIRSGHRSGFAGRGS
jgi:hypothetical protein